jgi:hypothetical protein
MPCVKTPLTLGYPRGETMMKSFMTLSSRTTFATLIAGLTSGVLLLSSFAQAQSPEPSAGPIEISDDGSAVDAPAEPAPRAQKRGGAPVVGRRAAQKYMGPHNAPQEDGTERASSGPIGSQLGQDDHYLAIHFGGFISDNAYNWGNRSRESDIGDATIGLTYRVGEWRNSMDLAVRIDYSGYGLAGGGSPSKLSFLPVITFPDASSRFPLYFGVGLGLGVFTHNVNDESALSVDYQLLLGARFFEVFQNTGFFIEAGIKNHFLILSDGQFNGTFVAAGPVFTF